MLSENEVIAIFLGSVATLFGSLYLVYLWGTNRMKRLEKEKSVITKP